MDRYRFFPLILLSIVLVGLLVACGQEPPAEEPPTAAADPAGPERGTLELVAELPINPGNIAVTADGRIFTTVHQFRRQDVQLIEVLDDGEYRAWPDETWNGEFGRADGFNSLLGIRIDRKGRLWVIDNGLGQPPQPPKLLAFDLETGELAYRYDFPEEIGPPGTFIQDLATDEDRGFVYLADVGGAHEPAIVIVDLENDTSRRFTGHPSLESEDVDLVVGGRTLQALQGEGPARVAINPITISADGEILYYGAMTGTTWYSLPTKLLREGASDEEIAAAITAVGPKPVSDGASTDAEGHHYFTDVGRDAIAVLTADGELETLVADERLVWPDALSFGEESWLYVAVNKLHLAPPFNGGEELGGPPYPIYRVWTGTEGVPGR